MYNFYKKSIHGKDARWFLDQLLKKKNASYTRVFTVMRYKIVFVAC